MIKAKNLKSKAIVIVLLFALLASCMAIAFSTPQSIVAESQESPLNLMADLTSGSIVNNIGDGGAGLLNNPYFETDR